jgi:catalase
MHGYSGHTHKFVNKDGKFTYIQIHIRADKGFKTLSTAQAGELSGSNPDYGIQSLFEAIENKDYPSWTVYVVC